MKAFILKISLVAAVLFAVNSIVFPQEKIDLKYKMPEGKTYLYKTVINSNVTQQAMGREMKFNSDVHTITRVLIKSVDDKGNLSLLVSPDSVTVHSNARGRDTTISLNDLIGKRTKLVISEYGDVLSKSMIDTLTEKAKMMGSSIMQSISSFYAKLPGKEISEGDNWKQTKTDTIDSMGGRMVVTSDYKYNLKGKENTNGIDCYEIPFTATLSTTGNANMSGMQFYIEGKGKMAGTLYISAADGSVVKEEGKNENEMTLATTGNQKMVIPVTQSSTSETDLITN